VKTGVRAPRPKILDFDIENRPLSYWYDGQCTPEITAIAAGWVGEEQVDVRILTYKDMETNHSVREASEDLLEWFVTLYNAADIVTGHFIRKHDLPHINGALVELGLPMLKPKPTIDTKMDLKRFMLPKSQEALGAMLTQFDTQKHLGNKEHMTQTDWRQANRLTVQGIRETKRRVVGDVKQHRELFAELSRLNYLNPGKTWRP
jgi:hypothetical protein